jgi:hypothetical protein
MVVWLRRATEDCQLELSSKVLEVAGFFASLRMTRVLRFIFVRSELDL